MPVTLEPLERLSDAPIVSEESIATQTALDLDDEPCCAHCGETGALLKDQPEGSYHYDGEPLCEDCFDQYYFTCADCDTLTDRRDEVWIENDDKTICQDCREDHYFICYSCDRLTHDDDGHSLSNGLGTACGYCYDNYYFTCDDCGDACSSDDRYVDGDYYYCECCWRERCEEREARMLPFIQAPFTIELPGVGGGIAVVNDTLFALTGGHSQINWRGIDQIQEELFAAFGYKNPIYTVLRDVQLIDGPGIPSLARRIERHLFKNGGLKMTPDLKTRIGDIAAKNRIQRDHFHLAVTRRLDQDAGYFCNDGSCWWQEYSPGRIDFAGGGGMALLEFAEESYEHGDSITDRRHYPISRVWLLPLGEDMNPTESAEQAAFWYLFNAYGDLSVEMFATLWAQAKGAKGVQRVSIVSSQMYINCNGFLVGPQQAVEAFAASGKRIFAH